MITNHVLMCPVQVISNMNERKGGHLLLHFSETHDAEDVNEHTYP